jgi:hypothetical protein
MSTIFDNLINGNLSDAKRQAKNKSMHKIYSMACEMGFEEKEALNMAAYLKGEINFQSYCDRKAKLD